MGYVPFETFIYKIRSWILEKKPGQVFSVHENDTGRFSGMRNMSDMPLVVPELSALGF